MSIHTCVTEKCTCKHTGAHVGANTHTTISSISGSCGTRKLWDFPKDHSPWVK